MTERLGGAEAAKEIEHRPGLVLHVLVYGALDPGERVERDRPPLGP